MKKLAFLSDTRYIDKPFWILFGILLVVAVIALFSAGSTLAYNMSHSILSPLLKQIVVLLMGACLAYLLQFVPSAYVKFGGYLLWGISVLLLYLVLVMPGTFGATINGAGRWFSLGPVQFQPSEFAKLSLIIVVADRLSRIHNDQDAKREFYITLIGTGITVFPIFTGNLSTAVLMVMVVGLMWILARMPWKYVLSTMGIGAIFLVMGYCIVEFHYVRQHRTIESGPFKRAITWVGRVDDMLSEGDEDEAEFRINDDNYQRSLAKVAIARGGKSPLGVLPGNSKERDYLPLAYADYIFAIIVEETGVIGAIFLIFIYLAILFRACYASCRQYDFSAMLMVMSLALMITLQALISMSVSVGIGPVTGQPLPLISKGGTSALVTCAYFGIMMGVAREQNEITETQKMAKQDSMDDTPDIQLEQ